MDPYEIWGNGQQERDFTYVEDIVEGTILAAENISDGTPVNLGTGQRYKIIDVVKIMCDIIGWHPSEFKFETSMPVGAVSRALDNTRAQQLLGWNPRFTLEEGLRRTMEWYVSTHTAEIGIKQEVLLER